MSTTSLLIYLYGGESIQCKVNSLLPNLQKAWIWRSRPSRMVNFPNVTKAWIWRSRPSRIRG